MTDFSLEQIEKLKSSEINILQFRNNIEKYANFLKQQLKLEMFVAERNEPTVDSYMQPKEMTRQYDEWFEKYGKEVLFEDFEIATNKEGEKVILGDYTCLKVSDLENGTIEDLVKYVHIKLTKSSVKRIFG
ncbi:MAG: hypothetical protein RL311_736 [Bacteroidota bacterium]